MSYAYSRITETLQNIFSNLYIPNINLYDFLEILIIIFIIYFTARAFKNTRTWIVVRTIFLLSVFYIVSYLFSFSVITQIFETAMMVFVVAVIIIFSPELKRVFENIGSKSFKFNIKNLIFKKPIKTIISDKTIEEIVFACDQMSKTKTGVLISYENNIPLNEFIDTGIPINATVSRQLLQNIFEHNTPLHDGAVIIKKDEIIAATCYLPLSNDKTINKKYGTRHRAAVGISESTDAFTIIVSEETGKISYTRNGKITVVTPEKLKNALKIFQEETQIVLKRKPLDIIKNNLLLKITSILLGVMLWLVVLNISNPIISKTITTVPISIVNANAISDVDKVYTIEGELFTTVTVTGHRKDIENLKKNDITIVADLSKLSEINTIRLYPKLNNKDIQVEIKDEIKKISIEDSIELICEFEINKIGKEDKSCYVREIFTQDENFKIKGPESIIKTIDKVVFDVDVENCKSDTQYSSKPIVYDKNGNIIPKSKLSFEKEELIFNISTLKTKEIDLIINLDYDEKYQKYINSFSIEQKKITVAADKYTLDNTNQVSITVPIDLKEDTVLLPSYTTKVDITPYLPSEYFVSNDNKLIDITIGFESEISEEFNFSFKDIEIINNPNNYNIIPYQNNFNVVITGDKNIISKLTLKDLKPQIDLKNISTGEKSLIISLNVPEKCSQEKTIKTTVYIKK